VISGANPITFDGILVAALGGAAIGVERQRSGHATGVNARFGGVRTFTLLGGVSGLAGWLAAAQLTSIATVLAAGAIALVVAGYAAASRRDIDATTEAAGLVVIAAGVLAGIGQLMLASGVIALTVLLLIEKSRLHALIASLDDEELRAAARFAVMAVVVLPLLPEGPFGPLGGVRPRQLWLLVLFFTGLSVIGYVARRLVGAAHGYPLAGLLGGLVSSTNVTFTFARLSRAEPALSHVLAIGVIGACTVLFPRVLLATLVLNAQVARMLLPLLIAPLAVALLGLVIWFRSRPAMTQAAAMPSNPLQFGPALQMAATFQIVLFAVELMRQRFGNAGVLVSGAVLGLTDVDALTISMTKSASDGTAVAVAAQAIALGILANCVMKTALAVALGTPRFRLVGGTALAAMALALTASVAVLR
jgi:uncharacterized membrane protein (DUF4010 family)